MKSSSSDTPRTLGDEYTAVVVYELYDFILIMLMVRDETLVTSLIVAAYLSE